jgi:hypothetical protein
MADTEKKPNPIKTGPVVKRGEPTPAKDKRVANRVQTGTVRKAR